MLFLKEFFEKIDFEINQQITKKHAKTPWSYKVCVLNLITVMSADPD